MKTRLGIAGVPMDVESVAAIADTLKVSLVYLIDRVESGLPPDVNVETLPAGDEADRAAHLGRLNLSGVWVAEGRYRSSIFPLAKRFGWPHLPCYRGLSLLPNTHEYTLEEFAQCLAQDSEAIGIPALVRTSCGDGDASCMRVEHPRDLSLALEKMRKRNPGGVLRVQPNIEGAIYRLLAFKTGAVLVPFDVVEESVTTSVYRVPLGMSMPVSRDGVPCEEILAQAQAINGSLPPGWGYVEMEFVVSGAEVVLTDLQAPARLGEEQRAVVRQSRGVDLLRACLECALGRKPSLSPTVEKGVALTWLLTRSGVVTSLEGVEAARQLPGVVDVRINARQGDILSHVVDAPSRERGGYIIAEGGSVSEARLRLEAARNQVWIHTSPALS